MLEDRELATTPLLVCANKIDLTPHISEPELIRELNLDYIVDNPWLVIPISALQQTNIEQVLSWLVQVCCASLQRRQNEAAPILLLWH